MEDAHLQFLRGLIVDRLGFQRVAELLDNVSIRTFDSYLLKGPGSPPSKDGYVPKVFSSRGGVDYFRPDGWVQVWINAIDRDPDFAELRDWPVAYHGTES